MSKVIPTSDPEVKALRQAAHRSFDRIWRRKLMSRSAAYGWLAGRLNIPPALAHMGMMVDKDQLERVIKISDQYLGTTEAQEDFADAEDWEP